MEHVVVFLSGFVFRAVQVLFESSLYLLIGSLTAGAIRGLFGPAKTRAFFGTGRFSGPFRAWGAAATLLPVCSLGVLPVLAELKRAGVRRDAVLTFAIAAPMLNPVSLLYGLSYLGPSLMLLLALGTVIVAVLVGLISGFFDPSARVAESDHNEFVPSVGLRRISAAAVQATQQLSGPLFKDLSIGVLGAALIAACLQVHWLSAHSFSDDPRAIPLWTFVSPLSYLAPEKGIVLLPEMLKFRQSSGAMFCLIVLGVGMTLGHCTWILRSYGRPTFERWVLSLMVLTVIGAYIVEHVVVPVGTANVDNDHFEQFANHFDGLQLSDMPSEFQRYFAERSLLQWELPAALVIVVATGALLRRGTFGRAVVFEDFVEPESRFDAAEHGEPDQHSGRLKTEFSPRVVISLMLGCGLMIVTVGLLAYFPAPAEVFRDMTIIKADLYGELGASTLSTPLYHLELLDRQAARLPVGAILRCSPPNQTALQNTKEFRSALNDLRRALEVGSRDEARTLFAKVQNAYDRCRGGYEVR